MVDFSGPTLGDVTVEVRARLDKLLNDFARARGETKKFETDMAGVTRATKETFDETNKLEAEYRALARAYDPVRAAATKYGDALVRIQRLQTAGMLSPQLARQWAGSARAEFDKTTAGLTAMGLAHEKAGAAATRSGHAAGIASKGWHLFTGFIGIATVEQLGEFAMKTLETTAAIGDLSKELGLSNKELQQYRLVGTAVGLTAEDMDGAFKQFNETVTDAAAGLDRPKKLFDLLKISLKDAGGQAKPTGQLFLELMDKIGQVGNTAQQKAALMLAFGDAVGPKMLKFVEMGSEGINRLKDEFADSVMDDQQIQQAEEARKTLALLKAQLMQDISADVARNSQALVDLANTIKDLGSWAIWGLQQVKDFFSYLTQNWSLPALFAAAQGKFLATTARGFNQAATTVTTPLGQGGTADIEARRRGLKLASDKGGGGIDLSQLLNRRTGRKGGGGGRTVENQFDREELRQREERLRLERSTTADLIRQNEIDKELIDIKVQQRAEQLDQMVSRKALTAKQAEQLKGEDAANALIEKELADRKMRADMIEQSSRYADEMLGLEQDSLSLELRMARTDEERRRIELLILSSKQQQQRNEIEKQIALAQEAKDTQRVAELVEERKKIIENQNAEIAAFDVEHLTGFAKFRNDLPKTVDEINEQIERIRFDKFRERLQQAADFIDDIGGAFGRLADPQELFKNPLQAFKNFIFDLTRIFNENFIQKPVEEWAKKAIGAPLAKQAFGKDLMKQGGLNTEQMNVALGLASNNLRILQVAAQQAAFALQQTAGAAGAGAGGGGFAGSLFGSDGNMADPMQVNLGEGLGVTGTIDFEQGLESTTAALDPLASTTGQLTQAMSAQIPILGQFGGGLMQVLSQLASGGGGGDGGLMSFLKMGLSIAGSAFGGGFPGSAGMSVPAAPGWLGSFGSMPVSLGSGLGVTGTIGWDTGGATGGSDPKKVAGVVHEQEYVFDAGATKMWGVPLLKKMQTGEIKPGDLMRLSGKPGFADGGFTGGSLTGMISSGRLPTWAAPRDSDYPGHSVGGRPITIGSINLHGVKDDRTARRSARQFRAGLQRELAYVNRSGLNR